MNLQCRRCSAELATDALVCRQCHSLVHSEKLDQLAASAQMLEEHRDFPRASSHWQEALGLLPQDSKQAAWIQEHVRSLSVLPAASTPSRPNWLGRLAPLAPIVIALSKGKALLALFNMKFLLSLGAFLGVYWSLYGMMFGIGFAAQILVHEMGHYIDVKRRGLPADMPIFLPGFGAFVRWGAMGVSLETRAGVSLAGPLAGWMAAAACAAAWYATGEPIWAALARTGAWLNLLNLIPVWALDGGQAVLALTRRDRGILCAGSVVLFLLTGDGVLFLIALGAAWKMFTKDFPEAPSPLTASYFAVVLCALAGLVWMLPGHGTGVP